MNQLFGYYWDKKTNNVTVYNKEIAKQLESTRKIIWVISPSIEVVAEELQKQGVTVTVFNF